jgi:hypothetical protein
MKLLSLLYITVQLFNHITLTQENHNGVISQLWFNYTVPTDYINKTDIKNIFFTNKDNLIMSINSQPENIKEPSLANNILFFNTTTKTPISYIDNLHKINAIDFKSDSNKLAFIDDLTNISIYQLDIDNNFKKLQQITAYYYNAIDLSINHDSSILAVAYNNKSFVFYDINKSLNPITSKTTKDTLITSLAFSPNKDFLVIQGRYLKLGTALKSKAILFNVSDYSNPKQIRSFGSVSIRDKIILSPIKQLIITYGYSKYTWPNILAYNWWNIDTIQWNRVYQDPSKKIIDFAVDKHKNILAYIKEDNYIYLLAMDTAKNCINDYFYFFTNDYSGKKILINKASSLVFNTNTTKLAILGDKNLQVYILHIPKKIKLPQWAICSNNTMKPDTTPISTNSAVINHSSNNQSQSRTSAIINNFYLIVTSILLLQSHL